MPTYVVTLQLSFQVQRIIEAASPEEAKQATKAADPADWVPGEVDLDPWDATVAFVSCVEYTPIQDAESSEDSDD